MSLDQIIIKLTNNQLDSLTRYFSLVNNSLDQKYGIMCLEQILDGILLIVNNLDQFQSLYHPVTDEIRNLALNFENDDQCQLTVNKS
jgi:hypothetical protein